MILIELKNAVVLNMILQRLEAFKPGYFDFIYYIRIK